jgi:hypothetical protein
MTICYINEELVEGSLVYYDLHLLHPRGKRHHRPPHRPQESRYFFLLFPSSNWKDTVRETIMFVPSASSLPLLRDNIIQVRPQ